MMRLVTGLLALASVSASAQAPDPMTVREPVVQVYGARTLGAKGLFGVHTWVAVKLQDADEWTIYEVIGWRLRWSAARSSRGRAAPS